MLRIQHLNSVLASPWPRYNRLHPVHLQLSVNYYSLTTSMTSPRQGWADYFLPGKGCCLDLHMELQSSVYSKCFSQSSSGPCWKKITHQETTGEKEKCNQRGKAIFYRAFKIIKFVGRYFRYFCLGFFQNVSSLTDSEAGQRKLYLYGICHTQFALFKN